MTNEERNEINRKKLHEILDIVLDGNGFEDRSRTQTGTLPTLFFCYGGHVNRAEVELHKNGWISGQRYDQSWNINLDYEINDKTVNDLKEAVSHALTDKTEAEVLQSDIQKREEQLAKDRETLENMKSALRRKLNGKTVPRNRE